MKIKKSFIGAVCIWIATVLIATALVAGISAFVCRAQLGEIIAYHRSEEESEYAAEAAPNDLVKEMDGHEAADERELMQQITPLSTTQKITLAVLAILWAAIFITYWFSIASFLARHAEQVKMSRRLWFWLAFFTNIFAVVAFIAVGEIFLKQCPNCGNYQLKGDYCSECGSALKVRCSMCRHVLKQGDRFCSQCGQKNRNTQSDNG